MTIKFYKTNETYGFLNNFKKARMFIWGRWWNNVEAAYQARKTNVNSEIDAIWKAATPREARDLGQKVTLRPDWDQIKDTVMYGCLETKFLQHPDLRAKLMATGDEELVEDSPIDYYWGCGKDGTGKNKLGRLLMQLRANLKGE